MAFIKGTPGDLAAEGARATDYQNLHGNPPRSRASLEVRVSQARHRGSIAQEAEQEATAHETDGNQHPEQGGGAEDFRGHGPAQEERQPI